MQEKQSIIGSFRIYSQPRMLAILVLGFASGLPLALTASTLTAWLAESGVSRASIGLFAAVATPYTLKFLWSPLVDGLRIPIFCRLFGRRRGWLFFSQSLLVASLLLLGLADPAANIMATALCAVLVAICSATQDIVIDAYRVELLKPEEQGAGAASVVLGYRIGMIVSTAGALYLATYFGWAFTYAVMAALIGVGTLAAFIAGEPNPSPHRRKVRRGAWDDRSRTTRPPSGLPPTGGGEVTHWLREYVLDPFREFTQRPHWLAILLFILLYKLADAFMGIMTNPFLLDIGFAKTDIANVVKLYGLAATIIGSFIGGAMVYRIGMVRTLWICGIAHALTNLMFVVQARVGADLHILALGITMENVSGGMGTAAFVAFISSLCNKHFTATQYALLSSLSAMGRTWLSTPAGIVSEWLGWEMFFVFATLLAAPGLLVLWWLNKKTNLQAMP